MLERSGVVFLRVEIVPLDNNIFTFTAVGKNVDLTGLTNPVTGVLTLVLIAAQPPRLFGALNEVTPSV
jgi:hypothetical protein